MKDKTYNIIINDINLYNTDDNAYTSDASKLPGYTRKYNTEQFGLTSNDVRDIIDSIKNGIKPTIKLWYNYIQTRIKDDYNALYFLGDNNNNITRNNDNFLEYAQYDFGRVLVKKVFKHGFDNGELEYNEEYRYNFDLFGNGRLEYDSETQKFSIYNFIPEEVEPEYENNEEYLNREDINNTMRDLNNSDLFIAALPICECSYAPSAGKKIILVVSESDTLLIMA